ncbi:MAG: mannose-1-phosphate guanylyltransferase [Proteobacteria bacterium]|nr:mannose-1-phosphate guanylyltransferase [Pseudomonadota bacterium]
MAPRLLSLVLAGGAGTRFWPASRRGRPKPFVPLAGGRTPLETTLERLSELSEPRDIAVIGGSHLARLTRAAVASRPGVQVLLEPEARNTAAAIAWGAAWAAGRAPDALVGVFPADHHIPHPRGFVRAVESAARAAADGENLALVGIEPSRPDPAYGYLRLDPAAKRGAARVLHFVEKPRPATARRYCRSGEYLWNSGMLVARPRRILAELRAHAPEVWDALGGVLERLAEGRAVARRSLIRAYRRVKPISFDYAVLERSERVRAVRGRFRWSDLGSWDALAEHLPLREGNRFRPGQRVLGIEARRNLVWAERDKRVVLLGVDDLVVVETPDALMVASADRAQDVRRVVAELERRGEDDLT